MKQKSIIYILLLSFTCGISFSSCEDMLDVQSDRHSYETAQDTLYAYWGILKTLQDVGERYVLLGELRGDLVMENMYDGEISDSLRRIANFQSINDGDCRYLSARDFYAIINNCNAYIASADLDRIVYGGTTDNSRYMLREFAQVEAIRAWTYLQLVQLYKEVPFYLEPMTSTGAIDDFLNNPNHEVVNAQTLPDKISGRLLDLIEKEDKGDLVYPQYGMYLNMVHSQFCYFPLHLVLGDIYLNANRYEDAANQYYTYMQKDKISSVLSTGRFSGSVGTLRQTLLYSVKGYECFDVSGCKDGRSSSETGSVETITVIPSTTNKLWGTVLRGINEAFGYTADIGVSTENVGGDTASVSSKVNLTPYTYKRQFIASNEFSRLCKSYPSLGINNIRDATLDMPAIAYEVIHTDATPSDTASDARYGWYDHALATTSGGNYTIDSCFISKQNPQGAFSTTYPVIYRQGLVWLRFAEAINRAGYPEYAFAVLRDGLYDGIVPASGDAEVGVLVDEMLTCLRTDNTRTETDIEGNEEVIVDVKLQLLPKGTTEESLTLEDNQTVVTFPYSIYLEPDEYSEFISMDDADSFALDSIDIVFSDLRSYLPKHAPSILHTTNIKFDINGRPSSCPVVACEYIPVNQFKKAQGASFLDFSSNNFKLTEEQKTYRLGIHQRGSNMIARTCYADDVYTFDKCIKSKWPAYEGPLNYYLTSGSEYAEYQENLIKAVEELIIDELALECCFEGIRYNDLVRFSTRDNRGTTWLQDKINKRGGTPVTITNDNMYLKLPK